jgi:hypothetical protein
VFLQCLGAGTNSTKPPCPVTNGTAVPAIRPVAVPEIVALSNGQILVGNGQQQQPTQIKVPSGYPTVVPQKPKIYRRKKPWNYAA